MVEGFWTYRSLVISMRLVWHLGFSGSQHPSLKLKGGLQLISFYIASLIVHPMSIASNLAQSSQSSDLNYAHFLPLRKSCSLTNKNKTHVSSYKASNLSSTSKRSSSVSFPLCCIPVGSVVQVWCLLVRNYKPYRELFVSHTYQSTGLIQISWLGMNNRYHISVAIFIPARYSSLFLLRS